MKTKLLRTVLLTCVIVAVATAQVPHAAADESPEFEHPVVQMLVPGFQVRELPVDLTNINNLRYRHDGKLIALAYNGDIYILDDSDGDGLEDTARFFRENNGSIAAPLGMVLTPPDSPHGNGVFLVCKGKVLLVTDRDGDDSADDVVDVATGWPVIPHGVDALGLAMADNGDLYFGIGVTNFANPYMVGDDGRAKFDLTGQRGTIQRISADLKSRETVCTGIRFPVGIAFNHLGDLFCTDQEGATWLANGNPLDELLHIQPDRHYGFPPRHPRHLPDVLDEPSVFNYGPQHQSTCGLFFNEPVNGGPTFGPEAWAHDAIVCGESRGQIWRTSLVKTDSGYVASNQTIVRLQMLTVDACVTPDGSLAVCCHSGPPDWGTGPTGRGRVFRIEPLETPVARPVATWIAGPDEIHIDFDRPVNPNDYEAAARSATVEYGRFVRAGRQFETLKPPYELVQRQEESPRASVPVKSAKLEHGGRTLILRTDPMPDDLHPHAYCAVTISLPDDSSSAPSGGIPQSSVLCVDAPFSGVSAEWKADGVAEPEWFGWLPHIDLDVCRSLLAHSATHEALWPLLEKPGVLKLSTRLNAADILRPAVQPGAIIDSVFPKEVITTHITADRPVTPSFRTRDDKHPARCQPAAEHTFTVMAGDARSIMVRLDVPTHPGKTPKVNIAFSTGEDDRRRAVTPDRLRLPWTKEHTFDDSLFQAARRIPEIAGGDWERGRALFHGEKAKCSKCHTRDGSSGGIAPDLKNLVQRDAYSVTRDIQTPSLTINPDYVSQVIVLKSGLTLTGILLTEDDQLILGDNAGKRTSLNRDDIESIYPSTVSIMPQDIAKELSAGELRDLLTYLLRRAPTMPADSPLDAPPVRSRDEVDRVLAGSEPVNESPKLLNVVLVGGEKDHGIGEHDYPAWLRMWEQLMAFDASLTLSTAMEFPSSEQLESADIAIFFQRGQWDDQRQQAVDRFQQRGGGLVYIHWSLKGWDRANDFAKRIGLSAGSKISVRHGPVTLDLHNTDHPILRNFGTLQLYDETYWDLDGDHSDLTLLATSEEDGQPRPQIWTKENGPGRVFVGIPGHYSWTFDDPLFRILLLRAIAWSAHEPIDRFNGLVFPGARMKE